MYVRNYSLLYYRYSRHTIGAAIQMAIELLPIEPKLTELE